MGNIQREQFLWNFFKNSNGIIPKCYKSVSLNSKEKINENAIDKNSSKLIYISLFPDFFDSEIVNQEMYNLIKIPHYDMSGAGILLDKKYTYETYKKEFLKASYLKTFRRSINRLEACFNIIYEYNYGYISEEKCNYLVECLKKMLEVRFNEKNTESVFLNDWDNNIANLRSLILQKRSSLFVIYNNSKPISISLNRHIDENISFSECHTYDVDYSKFSLGYIDIYMLLNWCINNNVLYTDLGLGSLEYKNKWCNNFYNIEYHIYYIKNSISAKQLANFEVLKIKIKTFIKKLKLKNYVDKLKHVFHNLGNSNSENKYKVEEIETSTLLDNLELIQIDLNSEMGKLNKRIVFDFLYSNIENFNDITIYKSKNNPNLFFVKGKVKAAKIEFITN